jgi:hypothetical protein
MKHPRQRRRRLESVSISRPTQDTKLARRFTGHGSDWVKSV